MSKQRLGRGLSALLKDPENDIKTASDKNADKVVGHIVEIDLTSIEVNPHQPRTHFNEDSLNELATSIKELGVIQPITVRKLGFDKYQLVSGERRFRASKLLGLQTIPAYIRIANDEESLMMALVENIQRQDLDPIEIALSYQRMIDELNLTQEQMSDKVGKKRSTITNYLRLLKLDPIVQTGIRDGFVSMGHGKAILNVEDNQEQIKIYNEIVAKNLSVRETENLMQQLKNPENPQKKPIVNKSLPDFAKNSIDDFRRIFNTNVVVKSSANGKGKIEIPFKSEEDFKRIQNLLQNQ